MTLQQLWEMPGGIYPPENKSQSTQLPIKHLPLPPQLFLPLIQPFGASAQPIVRAGERVLAGQLIARAQGNFSGHVHASTSGVIAGIVDYPLAHPSGLPGPCICIDVDHLHEPIEKDICEKYWLESRENLLEKIRAAGISGLGGAGFPTDQKLRIDRREKNTALEDTAPHIDTLIINGAECEPYITADDRLMRERASEVIAGSLLISFLLHHPERIIIAVEDNKPEAIANLQNAVEEFFSKAIQDSEAVNKHSKIEIIAVPTKYPSGGAKQLVYILTGREIPRGYHSADAGAICVNVATAAAAWRAVRFGEPLISRIITVTGDAVNEPRNCEVLLGTPIDFILGAQGFSPDKATRIIIGGSLMGYTLTHLNAPATKTTNCIIAPSARELPPPPPAQACIRCGLCADACPATLLPQQLFWYAQAHDLERLEAHNLNDCIECGACAYVCPSAIPLVQYYRAGKGLLRKQHQEKLIADRARQRFEFRSARFAQVEAEKEARRAARKQAANQAKALLATQKLSSEKVTAATITHEEAVENPQITVVNQAIDAAGAVQLSFEEQKAKCERMVNAAQIALANAKEPLVARNPAIPIRPDQLTKQQARIKQAELKLAEAEKKLAEFVAQNNSPIDDPMAASLARARAKMAMTPEEKRRANIELLETRLHKARERLAQAKTEQDTNLAVFRLGVTKLEEKLDEIRNQ